MSTSTERRQAAMAKITEINRLQAELAGLLAKAFPPGTEVRYRPKNQYFKKMALVKWHTGSVLQVASSPTPSLLLKDNDTGVQGWIDLYFVDPREFRDSQAGATKTACGRPARVYNPNRRTKTVRA